MVGILGHPLADLRAARVRARRGEANEVTFGEDPDRALAVDDDHRPDTAIPHTTRRDRERLRRRRRHRRCAHDLRHRAYRRPLRHRASLDSAAALVVACRLSLSLSLCSRRLKASVHPIVTRRSRSRRNADISRSYVLTVTPVAAWIRRLGNAGAVANAHTLADQRAAEDWVVEVVAGRMGDQSVDEVRAPISDPPASAA